MSEAARHVLSLNSPIEPDAARPESVEPVTLSDRVNAVINPTANPSSDVDLPDQFSYEKLEEIATAEAKVKTNNNDLGISNHFYNTRLKMKLKKLKGFQKNESYVQSPEYNDLQLVLDQFAKSRTNVIFVIPPVNAKWMKYTGLSQEKYEQAVQKIRYQLESQGFTNIADFSKDGDQTYFMEDTIHMGWNGWLAFDKAVNPFVTKAEKAPTYHLNDRFFSKDWAQYKGTPDEFK